MREKVPTGEVLILEFLKEDNLTEDEETGTLWIAEQHIVDLWREGNQAGE